MGSCIMHSQLKLFIFDKSSFWNSIPYCAIKRLICILCFPIQTSVQETFIRQIIKNSCYMFYYFRLDVPFAMSAWCVHQRFAPSGQWIWKLFSFEELTWHHYAYIAFFIAFKLPTLLRTDIP